MGWTVNETKTSDGWEQTTVIINPTYMNLWGRIKTAWQVIRDKTQFEIKISFKSPEGTMYVDDVDGQWVDKGDK